MSVIERYGEEIAVEIGVVRERYESEIELPLERLKRLPENFWQAVTNS